jgi:phosphate transport system substrate-binding protein
VAIKADESSPAVLPTAENVASGTYPISRGLYFYLRRAPEGSTKDFVDYALSEAGQAVVTDVGYFPVR